MDNENVERLIECVRRHEFLYDLSNKDYKNVALKSAVWESIGRELNQTGEAVKNKWKTIRDGYTKHKKQMTGHGKKTAYYYTWASQLSFMDDYNTQRVPYSNVEVILSTPSLQNSILDSGHSQDFISPGDSSPQTPPSASSPALLEMNPSTIPRQSRSIKRNQDDMTKVLNILNKKKRKEHDGIDHLFLSYADTFKKFPLYEQALLKLELAKLFTNTEFRLLRQSQYASTTSPAYSNSSIDNIGSTGISENNSPLNFPVKLSYDNLPVDVHLLNNSISFDPQTQLLHKVKKEDDK